MAQLDFLVVVDHFTTASARHANLFLPCTTYLEMTDLGQGAAMRETHVNLEGIDED